MIGFERRIHRIGTRFPLDPRFETNVHQAVPASTQNKEKRGQEDDRPMYPARVACFIYRSGCV